MGCGIEVEILFGGTTKRLQHIDQSKVKCLFERLQPQNQNEQEENNN